MSFVSYAQNYEDVMLARAFAGVERGFYVDVGAQDPRFDSVTKAFYDLGWHGINLEPVEHWHRKLVEERPRDINLCLAAGDHAGAIEFHETDESGLSTASAEFARRHREAGHALRTRQVPVDTLDAICRRHDVREVHFLKVDVEGAEAEVLRGLDLARLRPWVILVEATEPNSRVSNHAQWEALVTDHDYRLVYQDGLNRFYLAREHEALAPAFAAPPNIFDDFVRRELVDLQAMLEAHIARLDGRIAALESALGAEQELSARRRDELQHSRGETLAERELSAQRLQALERSRVETIEARTRGRELAQALAGTEQAVARLSRELADAQAEQRGTLDVLSGALSAHAATLAELGQAQADFQQLVSSRSWRLTAPLRRAMARAAYLRERGAEGIRALARWRPARVAAAVLLAPFPTLSRRVKRGLYGEAVAAPEAASTAPALPAAPLVITRDARQILERCPVRTDGLAPEDAD